MLKICFEYLTLFLILHSYTYTNKKQPNYEKNYSKIY